MQLVFTEEQEELRRAARAFLSAPSASEQVRAAMAADLGYDADTWKRIAAELGWTGVAIPEQYGGAGLGFVELVALLEEMRAPPARSRRAYGSAARSQGRACSRAQGRRRSRDAVSRRCGRRGERGWRRRRRSGGAPQQDAHARASSASARRALRRPRAGGGGGARAARATPAFRSRPRGVAGRKRAPPRWTRRAAADVSRRAVPMVAPT
jgi:hypothetical protein